MQVWMCGGKVLISTCSRVGHVFRKVSPYSWPGGVVNILNHNTMRTAEVWMDRHKEFYYKLNPCKSSRFSELIFITAAAGPPGFLLPKIETFFVTAVSILQLLYRSTYVKRRKVLFQQCFTAHMPLSMAFSALELRRRCY